MSVAAARLDEFEQKFFGGDREAAMGVLSQFLDDGINFGPGSALAEVVQRVDHRHAGFAAYLALAGGALVENGLPAGALGRALVPPLTRALVDARRMLDHVAPLPDAEDEDDEEEDGEEGAHEHDGHIHSHADGDHDHDHDHDHDDDHADHILIGRKAVDRAFLDDLAERDVAAIQAWFSLDVWYRPAVATWTRDPAVLREIQDNADLRGALAALGNHTETSHWLSLLIETVFEGRFVVLVPELDEAYALTADGLGDMGQLYTLLSQLLRDPLERLGVSDFASKEVLAVMRGDGPQRGEGAFGCQFHCYPIQATDPATGLPRDNVHEWLAPGGTGTHSLPADFLPGTLPPIDGSRVLVLAGPKSPGMRFERVIPAVRTFDALQLRVTPAKQLAPDEARRWFAIAKQHAA